MRFKNKICLVSGGTSGIGRAAAEQFGREGGTVIVVGRKPEEGDAVVKTIEAAGAEALFIQTDIGDPAQIEQCVKTIIDKYGRIDIVVNDAAMMTFTPIVDLSIEDWDKVMHVNLRSIFLFCKYALPHMHGGAIVNLSSVHAHQTTPNVLPYAATKGAIEAFTRGLCLEYPSTQARFNCVAPGAVDTPMLWDNPNIKDGKEKIQGAIGKPENLAAAICFLASDDAAYINGTTLVVDGGRLDIL
ncbi:SDR family NAD(P)-dependent oxidoreductase [Mucilaginibacter koreensis]